MKVVVVGCGLVGLTAAHALIDDGHAVTMVDREGPAAGASRGNAGWLAHTDILPIASPNMWRQLPRWIVDPLGPLAIRPSYLLPLLPWLARFVAASRRSAVDHSIRAMAALQIRALPAWQALSARLGIGHMIHQRGGLYAFDDATAFAALQPIYARQRALGMTVEFLASREISSMEPALSAKVVAAAYFPDAAHVGDPRVLTEALCAAAIERGMAFERRTAVDVRRGTALQLVCGDAEPLTSDAIVIAAGAWSKPLAAALGDRVPLDTERGYNVSFPAVTGVLSRPVSFAGHGFVATPLDTGLRIGGAVEFGGLNLAPNNARTRALYGQATSFIRDLPRFETGTMWMGFRPSIPDSLPVIGRSRLSQRVIYAFGHGHYGLTQSAVTAGLVADLIASREPRIDLSPYSPRRF